MTHSEDFIKRMFAAYIGCPVSFGEEGRNLYLVGVTATNCMLHYEQDGWMYPRLESHSNCKLILTPLSRISGKDRISAAKIITKGYLRHFKDGEITFKDVDGSKRVGVFRNGVLDNIVHIQNDGIGYYEPEHSIGSTMGDLSVQRRTYYTPNALEAYDILRKLKYDVGFESTPSLIEAGLAISSIQEKPIELPADQRSVATNSDKR